MNYLLENVTEPLRDLFYLRESIIEVLHASMNAKLPNSR